MTATTQKLRTGSLGDRFAEITVLALTLVALALGWWLKTSVQNRSRVFDAGNISAQTPAGWLLQKPSGNEVLHVTDRTSTGFGTTYIIEQQAVPADADPNQVAGLLSLDRGNKLTAYRVLKQQDVQVAGRSAVEIDYVYVESDANVTHAVIPAVVRGLDYVFVQNGQAVVVTYRADQSLFDSSLGRFLRFLVSVKF